MLNDFHVFGSFSTDQLMDTYIFYSNVLGIEAELISEEIMHLKPPASSPVVIYYKEDHQPATFTVLNIQVRGIRKIVMGLLAENVQFVSEPESTRHKFPEDVIQDLNNSLIAWIKDPGDNIIALIEG